MKNKIALVIFFMIIFHAFEAFSTKVVNTPEQWIEKGKMLYKKGCIEDAAQVWEHAMGMVEATHDKKTYIDILTRLGKAYQRLGYHQKALSVFEKALPAIEKNVEPHQTAQFFSSFGDIYLSLGNIQGAFDYIQKALASALLTKDSRLIASVLNNLGNVYVADKNYQGAVKIYDECLAHLGSCEPSDFKNTLKANTLLNLLLVLIQAGNAAEIKHTLNEALEHIQSLSASYGKAQNLLALNLLISKRNTLYSTDQIRIIDIRYQLLKEAKQIAKHLQNARLLSYAYGYMGQLYAEHERYSEAATLIRSAIFWADQRNAPEILYLWQRQMGELYKNQGDIEHAIQSYNQAISSLNPIHQEFFRGYRSGKDSFKENIKPVYLELAELLLKQAENSNLSKTQAEHQLRKARDVLELLKTAELQNFFEDECVTALEQQTQTLNRTEAHTAVIYPIIFPDYLTLILTMPDGMKQIRISIDSKTLENRVLQFRRHLQTRSNNLFMHDAWMLYDHLIRPIEPIFTTQEIHTLIVVPDGVLRLIPFSALHDGKQYLVEKYAVGIIPGMTLTISKPLEMKNSKILLAGLSKSVQNFPALPEVLRELEDVRQIMNPCVVLQDETYTLDHLTKELKKHAYTIVHLATHGIFRENLKQSFLLTYDAKLTMNHLEDMLGFHQEKKLELLTLSACQTAQGDEWAALGLAGLALKSGAKGALATLWFIDDEAAAVAVKAFYQQLRVPGNSKAKALQYAQKQLISQRRFRHPGYWAPFLMIGNWL